MCLLGMVASVVVLGTPASSGPPYTSCSVVSTSGKLLQHADGAAIDASDAVIRLGWGPVKGFEPYVGERQTMRLTSMTFLEPHRGVPQDSIRAVLSEMPEGCSISFSEHVGWSKCFLPALAPILSCHPRVQLVNMPHNKPASTLARHCLNAHGAKDSTKSMPPTSGFASIFTLLATGLCQELRLWGFLDDGLSESSDVKYHYFTTSAPGGHDGADSLAQKFGNYAHARSRGRWWWHDFLGEHQWLARAAERIPPMSSRSDSSSRMLLLTLEGIRRACPRVNVSSLHHASPQLQPIVYTAPCRVNFTMCDGRTGLVKSKEVAKVKAAPLAPSSLTNSSARTPTIRFDYTALYSRFDAARYHVSNHTANELAFMPLLQHLSQGYVGNVVALGCGMCAVLPRLQQLSQGRAYGMDASTTALAMATELGRGTGCAEPPCLKVGTLADVPWPDQAFDLGISADVLEHLHPSDVPSSVAELTRVVKGILLLSIASGSSRRSGVELHLTQRPASWWTKEFVAVGWAPVELPRELWVRLWKRPSAPRLWNFDGPICQNVSSLRCGNHFLAFARTPEHSTALQKAAWRVIGPIEAGIDRKGEDRRRQPIARPRVAFATFCILSTASVPTIANHCLASVGSLLVTSRTPNVDVVVLLDGGAMRHVGEALRRRGIKTVLVDDINGSSIQRQDWKNIARRQRHNLLIPRQTLALQKLRLFNLTAYDRVVAFDPDVLWLKNASLLLEYPPFAVIALHNSSWGCKGKRYINTGLMVLEPSQMIYRELVTMFINGSFFDCGGSSGTLDDQDVVREALDRGILGRFVELPMCYNYRSWPWQKQHCPSSERLLIHGRKLWPAALSVNGRSVNVDSLARAMSDQLLTFELPFIVYSQHWDQTRLHELKAEIRIIQATCHDRGEGGDNRTMQAQSILPHEQIPWTNRFLNDSTMLKHCRVHLQRMCTAYPMVSSLSAGQASGGGWHVDSHRPGIKSLMYLDDVGPTNGPFTMLLNYASLKHNGDHRRTRYDDTEIERQIRAGASQHIFVGAAGTVIVFDTAHVHRGLPAHDSRMTITNYYNNPLRTRCG